MKKSVVTGIAAAGIAVIAGASFYQTNRVKRDLPLGKSAGVSIKYTSMLGEETSTASLTRLSEKQILCDNRTIVRGTVEKIVNIAVPDRACVEAKSLMTLKVEEVISGTVKRKEITVLMPFAVNSEAEAEDTSVLSHVKEGMTGLFILTRYGAEEYEEDCDGSRLYLSEVAEYGLMDGERFALLQTDQGIVYSAEAFPGLKKDATMEDAVLYIKHQIKVKENTNG